MSAVDVNALLARLGLAAVNSGAWSGKGGWSQSFLVWTAMLDVPMEVLEPRELIDAARTIATRLATAA